MSTSGGHNEEHGEGHHAGGHHGGNPAMDWIITHMGGGLQTYGDGFEVVMNKVMMPTISGWFITAGKLCVFLMTPILLLAFIMYFLQ